MAAARGVTLASVLPQAALKAMSARMPELPQHMLALPYVTRANYHKYGEQLLQITSAYAIEKMGECFILYRQAFNHDLTWCLEDIQIILIGKQARRLGVPLLSYAH